MNAIIIYCVILCCFLYCISPTDALCPPCVHNTRIALVSNTALRQTGNQENGDEKPINSEDESRRQRLTKRVRDLAKNIVRKPIAYAAPYPLAIASVLKEATLGAVDMAVDEVLNRRKSGISSSSDIFLQDVPSIVDDAFLPLEKSLSEMEDALVEARKSMQEAKLHAIDAVEAAHAAAIAQAKGTQAAVAEAERQVVFDLYSANNDVDISELKFEDVDYGKSEMAPPFIGEDQCLVPGEPVVRVEKAPENSRRIFAGIDISASVDEVWKILTDYENLQNVIPNLVTNKVLDRYDAVPISSLKVDASKPEDVLCKQMAQKMKGALLKQVGGAKVAGINFSARATLEVREWPQGLPDFAHFNEEVWEGKSRKERAKDYTKIKLQRYRFPRPFSLSSLPTRDISMQNIENDDGEFRVYQGVWRMQPLPGCAPAGKDAMRLTYAVEVSPRAYLPVQLVEGRIVKDLCANLEAIRDYVASRQVVA